MINSFSFLALAFYGANMLRALCVPGSQLRYVLTSVAWAVCWAPPLTTLLEALNQIPHWPFWLGCTAVVWSIHMWSLLDGDDDNYWRRTRHRISGWLRAQLRRPVLVGARI
jgi:hypothetical protein